MAKSLVRLQARELRKKGIGIKTIAYKLHVSSSTVSIWCRDIQLSDKQIKKLQKNAKNPYFGRRLEYIKSKQQEKIDKINRLTHEGMREVGVMTEKELFIAGINLYWAEGFKKDNLVGFANTDVEMIKLFLKWLFVCCGVSEDRIKLRLGINEQYKDKIKIIEQYWSESLGISLKYFQKPYIQKVQWKKIYDNPNDYHGVLRVRVSKSIDLLRKINGWIEGIRINTR